MIRPSLPAFDGLVDVFRALAPDVAARFGSEPLATCQDCAMKPRAGVPETSLSPVFPAPARCCTYHPELPCYAVGRALRRGGVGAQRIRARLANAEGLEPGGLRAPASYRAKYHSPTWVFGHDQDMACPFWSAEAPEGQGCSIHLDREATCRTWHCRLERGRRSHAAWMALDALMTCIENTLVAECLREGSPPEQGASAEAWEAWYLWCAEHVEQLSDEQVERLRGEQLEKLIREVHQRADERDLALPDVVMPTIQSWERHAHGITLIAWSSYDPFDAPPWIFELLSRLDGKTPWRRAKAEAEIALGRPIGDDLVLDLFRRGLLGLPEWVDVAPGMTVSVKPGL